METPLDAGCVGSTDANEARDPPRPSSPTFKFSNHDVAYHMGMMDSLTIMFEREQQNAGVADVSTPIDIPEALHVALDARNRYLRSSGDFRDSAKAATMAQRSVENISYHAGSMPDVIVYTLDANESSKKLWTWAPAFCASVTERSKAPPANRVYETKQEAQQAADEFATKVQEVSRWADSGIRRSVHAWTQRRQRVWANVGKDRMLHVELCPICVGNYVVIYRRLSTSAAETAIETVLHIVHHINTKHAHLIHLGTAECPNSFIVIYGVVAARLGNDPNNNTRQLVKRELERVCQDDEHKTTEIFVRGEALPE